MSGRTRLAEIRRKAAQALGEESPREDDIPMGVPKVTVATVEGPSAMANLQTSSQGSGSTDAVADPSPSQTQARRIVVDLKESSPPSKKSHHGKDAGEKRNKSLPFRVDEYLKVKIEEFNADPLGSSLNVFKHFHDLYKVQKESFESRLREALRERDEARKQLGLISNALAQARKDLCGLKEEKKKLEEARQSDAQKFKDLEGKLKKAEFEANKAKESALNSQTRTSELEAKLEKVKSELEKVK